MSGCRLCCCRNYKEHEFIKTLKEYEFIQAANEGDIDTVIEKVRLGVDIHAEDNVAIKNALFYSHVDIVHYLIFKGAKLPSKNAENFFKRNDVDLKKKIRFLNTLEDACLIKDAKFTITYKKDYLKI